MNLCNRICLLFLIVGLIFLPGCEVASKAGGNYLAPLRLAGSVYASEQPCDLIVQERPLVFLVLGQSNAGNHGQRSHSGYQHRISLIHRGKCFLASEPLPGASGRGGNIWSRLPELLYPRRIAIALLAVESTPVRQWVEPGSLLWELKYEIASIQRVGGHIDLVLWQQGEADARDGTLVTAYRNDFLKLRSILRESGVEAPVMLAKSTRCRGEISTEVRSAIDVLVSEYDDVWMGPDTDKLQGVSRIDGCHFSEQGLDAAARMWAEAINSALSSPREKRSS